MSEANEQAGIMADLLLSKRSEVSGNSAIYYNIHQQAQQADAVQIFCKKCNHSIFSDHLAYKTLNFTFIQRCFSFSHFLIAFSGFVVVVGSNQSDREAVFQHPNINYNSILDAALFLVSD